VLRIGLVIPVLNNFDQAVDLIYSAKTQHELKIYIQPQYRYQVPLAAAWNRGIDNAIYDGCDYIIVSNDDVLFAPFSIDDAINFIDSDKMNLDLLGFRDVSPTYDDPFMITFAELDDMFHPDNTIGGTVYRDDLFSCFVIKRDFFDKFGTFDENFDPAWWEDTDMLYRISLLGGEVFPSPVPYIHLKHQTTKKINAPLNSIKSGEYYFKKWGSAKKDLHELYKTPYNDPTLSPKQWRKF